MEDVGNELGSDIPYCLRRGTVLGTGVGSDLTNLQPCPKCYIVLGKLPLSVSTAIVYNNIKLDEIVNHPRPDKMIKAMELGDIKMMGQALGNTLEEVTIKMIPEIANVKRTLLENGAMGALMSGSGPTVFGLFESYEEARIGATAIRNNHRLREVYITEIFHGNQPVRGVHKYGRY